MNGSMMQVEAFFDKNTNTLTYVVYHQESLDAVVIDCVWDYDPATSKLSTTSLSNISNFIMDRGLNLHLILETHVHADHITGAKKLQKIFPKAKIAIGSKIKNVQKIFKNVLGLENLNTDGSQFDLLLEDQQEISFGKIKIKTLHTPGHTPACSSYLIDNLLFTGDVLFMPDTGTGRCDFPGGSSIQIYKSIIEKIYTLPEDIKIYVGHDYQILGRNVKFESTVGESKYQNIHLTVETSEKNYVEFRSKRDLTLSAPKLLLPSIQINLEAGNLPIPDKNGLRFLKIPIEEV